jgi:hypothetical protein
MASGNPGTGIQKAIEMGPARRAQLSPRAPQLKIPIDLSHGRMKASERAGDIMRRD